MDARPNEIATSTAATLLGISGEMFRRVAKSGHIVVHKRGVTTVDGAVQGYANFLREDARRAEANASAVRAHQAKAATVAAANSRRRAGLIDVEEVEFLLGEITRIASDRLGRVNLSGRASDGATQNVAHEIKVAAVDIEAARAAAVALLKGEKSDDD